MPLHPPASSALRSSILLALGLSPFACSTEEEASPCEDPEVIAQPSGSESGVVTCASGSVERVASVECTTENGSERCMGTEDEMTCTTDADCTDKPHGACIHRSSDFFGVTTSCGCQYTCATDADCSAGQACLCAGVQGGLSVCVTAGCKTGADCASGHCALSIYDDGCGTSVQLACRTPEDQCSTNADCGDGETCAITSTGTAWSCLTGSCAIGRPLLVEGSPRRAPRSARADWTNDDVRRLAAASAAPLAPADRAALAHRYAHVASMEHASVASFARFTLELLALGAPPDLLTATQQAAADEVRHAESMYALASGLGGRAIGPGPLDLRGAEARTDRRAILAGLIEEACVGETLGVAEALAAAAEAHEPWLGALLASIAADEQRHAELAWRVLSWMLSGASTADLDFAEETLAAAALRYGEEPLGASDAVAGWGVLGPSATAVVRRGTLRDVVLPCARALLDRARRA